MDNWIQLQQCRDVLPVTPNMKFINKGSGPQMIGCQIHINPTQENKSPLELPYCELPTTVENFCGREDELKKIHQLLQDVSVTILSQIISISGLGGIGKTETAKMYAFKYKEKYGIILYIIGENETTLSSEFYRIANVFNINIKYEEFDKSGKKKITPKSMKNIVREIYEFCSSYDTLIIMDNIEEQEHIVDYLPHKNKNKTPKIIITSRKQNWDLGVNLGVVKTISLDVFPYETSREFIMKCLDKNLYTERDISKLSERMNNFPLALKQAVGLVRKENSKLRKFGRFYKVCDYLREINQKAQELLKYTDTTDIYKLTVLTTWKMTIDKLETNYGEEGVQAKKILEWIAFLKPDYILAEEIFHVETDKLNREAICLLNDYSMIEVRNDNIIVHRLVQEVTKMDIQKNGREEEVLNTLVQLLNSKDSFLSDNLGVVWESASRYPKILKDHYYSFDPTPIFSVMDEEKPDFAVVKTFLDFEYQNKRYKNILNSFESSLSCGNVEIVKYYYYMLKEKCKYRINIDKYFEKSIKLSKNKEILDFFLSMGCDINCVFKSKKTPIMVACHSENNFSAKYLLSRNCNVDCLNSNGEDCLMIACQGIENEDIVKALISTGNFDLNAKDFNGKTALFHTYNNSSDSSIMSIILDSGKIDLNFADEEGNTHFMCACSSGHIESIYRALENDECDVNVQNSKGLTGLMIACIESKIEVVRHLANNKRTNLKLSDKIKHTALTHAYLNAKEGDSDDKNIFKILYDTGKYNLNDRDHNGRTPFMYACHAGCVDIVENAIKDETCCINMQDNEGLTGLMYACEGCHYEIVHLLVNSTRTDLLLRDNRRRTALFRLFYTQQSNVRTEIRKNIFDILINTSKYNLNHKDNKGRTVFMLACKHDCVDIVESLLVNIDCDVNIQDNHGLTGLMKACDRFNIETVRLLVNNNRIDLNLCDLKNNNALTRLIHWPVGRFSSKFNETFEILFNTGKYDMDGKDVKGRTSFMCACAVGLVNILDSGISNEDFDLNTQDDEGLTGLMYAIKNCNLDSVYRLIEDDRIDFNLCDRKGRTVLEQAYNVYKYPTGETFPNIFEAVFRAGKFDLNRQDKKRCTPFMYACKLGCADIVEDALKDMNCDVNLQNKDGSTGLMIACVEDQIEVVRLLVNSERINLYNVLARVYNTELNIKIFKMLMDTGKYDMNERDYKGRTPFMYACEIGCVDTVENAIRNEDCDINAQDHKGLTGLMYALKRHNYQIVYRLIKTQRINLNLINRKKRTALTYAYVDVKRDIAVNVDIFETLFNIGKYDLNAQDNEGCTSFMYACAIGCIDIVRKSIENDFCDINIQDYNGLTGAMHACIENNMEIVYLLLKNSKINLNLRDNAGYTLFLHVCKTGTLDVIEFFIDNCKFNINVQDNKGRNALHIIVLRSNHNFRFKTIYDVLIKNRCNPKHKDKYDKTPLDYCRVVESLKKKHGSVSDIYQQRDSDSDSDFDSDFN